MKVAVLVPVRRGGSGGFIKHLQEVIPRWLRSSALSRLSIIAPQGTLDGLEKLDTDIFRVSQDDYRTGFQDMSALVSNHDYDAVLSTTARPVKLTGYPIVTMVQNIEPIQKAIYPMPLVWRMRLWALRREHATMETCGHFNPRFFSIPTRFPGCKLDTGRCWSGPQPA